MSGRASKSPIRLSIASLDIPAWIIALQRLPGDLPRLMPRQLIPTQKFLEKKGWLFADKSNSENERKNYLNRMREKYKEQKKAKLSKMLFA